MLSHKKTWSHVWLGRPGLHNVQFKSHMNANQFYSCYRCEKYTEYVRCIHQCYRKNNQLT